MGKHVYIPSQTGTNKYLKQDNHTISDSLNEIIDNAIDQGATKVNIDILKNGNKTYLSISNNGKSISSWESFFTLGGESTRSKDAIGHYGVGLKQFLSLFKTHVVFSFSGKNFSLRKQEIGEEFTYEDSINKNSFEYIQAEKAFKKNKSGILVLVEVDEDQLAEWEEIEVYEKSAMSYYFSDSISIFFKNKEIKKKHPFGGLNLVKKIDLKDYSGVSLTYHKAIEGEATRERRGAFLLFRGRLINFSGKYWFTHEEYNGHVLLIEVDSWDNKVLKNNFVTIVNQKNDFYINKKSPFFNKLQTEVNILRQGVETSGKKKNKLKKELQRKNVLESMLLPKGLKRTEDGNIVDKSGSVKGSEMSGKELERYLAGEIGVTLRKVFGHEHNIDSGRYFKEDKKLELVVKIEKNLDIQLKNLFYNLVVLEEFESLTKISCKLAVAYAKAETSSETSFIKERLKKKGVVFP